MTDMLLIRDGPPGHTNQISAVGNTAPFTSEAANIYYNAMTSRTILKKEPTSSSSAPVVVPDYAKSPRTFTSDAANNYYHAMTSRSIVDKEAREKKKSGRKKKKKGAAIAKNDKPAVVAVQEHDRAMGQKVQDGVFQKSSKESRSPSPPSDNKQHEDAQIPISNNNNASTTPRAFTSDAANNYYNAMMTNRSIATKSISRDKKKTVGATKKVVADGTKGDAILAAYDQLTISKSKSCDSDITFLSSTSKKRGSLLADDDKDDDADNGNDQKATDKSPGGGGLSKIEEQEEKSAINEVPKEEKAASAPKKVSFNFFKNKIHAFGSAKKTSTKTENDAVKNLGIVEVDNKEQSGQDLDALSKEYKSGRYRTKNKVHDDINLDSIEGAYSLLEELQKLGVSKGTAGNKDVVRSSGSKKSKSSSNSSIDSNDSTESHIRGRSGRKRGGNRSAEALDDNKSKASTVYSAESTKAGSSDGEIVASKNNCSGIVAKKSLEQLLTEALAISQTPEEITRYLVGHGRGTVDDLIAAAKEEKSVDEGKDEVVSVVSDERLWEEACSTLPPPETPADFMEEGDISPVNISATHDGNCIETIRNTLSIDGGDETESLPEYCSKNNASPTGDHLGIVKFFTGYFTSDKNDEDSQSAPAAAAKSGEDDLVMTANLDIQRSHSILDPTFSEEEEDAKLIAAGAAAKAAEEEAHSKLSILSIFTHFCDRSNIYDDPQPIAKEWEASATETANKPIKAIKEKGNWYVGGAENNEANDSNDLVNDAKLAQRLNLMVYASNEEDDTTAASSTSIYIKEAEPEKFECCLECPVQCRSDEEIRAIHPTLVPIARRINILMDSLCTLFGKERNPCRADDNVNSSPNAAAPTVRRVTSFERALKEDPDSDVSLNSDNHHFYYT